MAAPIKQTLVGAVNAIAELHTFIQTVPGWTVDKYVTDSELYIHNTSTDGTIGYWSFEQVADSTVPNFLGWLRRYTNTGFNTSQAVDEQPGVVENLSEKAIHEIGYSFNDYKCVLQFIANNDFLLIYSIVPKANIEYLHYAMYNGVIEKAFSYTGGQYSYGSYPATVTVPNSMVYYDDGVTGKWYTDDGGAFTGVSDSELILNYIEYSYSVDRQFSTTDMSHKLYPFELYITADDGYAPIGYTRNLWYRGNIDTDMDFLAEMKINGNIYTAISTDLSSSFIGDLLVVKSGEY